MDADPGPTIVLLLDPISRKSQVGAHFRMALNKYNIALINISHLFQTGKGKGFMFCFPEVDINQYNHTQAAIVVAYSIGQQKNPKRI